MIGLVTAGSRSTGNTGESSVYFGPSERGLTRIFFSFLADHISWVSPEMARRSSRGSHEPDLVARLRVRFPVLIHRTLLHPLKRVGKRDASHGHAHP